MEIITIKNSYIRKDNIKYPVGEIWEVYMIPMRIFKSGKINGIKGRAFPSEDLADEYIKELKGE
jgi:hypothetical protein